MIGKSSQNDQLAVPSVYLSLVLLLFYYLNSCVLLPRYSEAPVESNTYPDKNVQAAALSTSVISHRYLTEAALEKESMILHFEDIASIHIVILKVIIILYCYSQGDYYPLLLFSR